MLGRDGVKFDFRSESCKMKFNFIIFQVVFNLIIGCSKKNRGNYPKKLINREITKPGIKSNPGLAAIGLRTTVASTSNKIRVFCLFTAPIKEVFL